MKKQSLALESVYHTSSHTMACVVRGGIPTGILSTLWFREWVILLTIFSLHLRFTLFKSILGIHIVGKGTSLNERSNNLFITVT